MATATAEAPVTTSEVATFLQDNTMPVKALLGKIKDRMSLSRAWSAGDVEFGRRTFVTNGKTNDVKSATIIVEKGWAWSGPKNVNMKQFKDLIAEDDRLPKAAHYKEYPEPKEDAEPNNDPNAPSPLVTITEAQAHTMIGLHVRLTDKGLASLNNG